VEVGRLVAGLHRVDFAGAIGLDPRVRGAGRGGALVRARRPGPRRAPFADELDDPRRAGVVRSAYAEAGGPGRVEGPADFAMPIAQLSHIVAEGCRRWLGATTADERRDNEGWVREFVDAPLTRAVIEALLATP
jgi:hypothetical protein